MANRTGTYVAFDGLGQTDPTKSDFRYYGTIQAWASNNNIDFKYVDSHDKTSAVRDTSKIATLEARIQERLRSSKNMIVILSSDTRKSGSMLSYEIELAVDTYALPLIVTYPGYRAIRNPSPMSGRWPNALSTRINNASAKAIHLAFAKEPILDAIGQFSVNSNDLTGSKNVYSIAAHRQWSLLNTSEQDGNYLKS